MPIPLFMGLNAFERLCLSSLVAIKKYSSMFHLGIPLGYQKQFCPPLQCPIDSTHPPIKSSIEPVEGVLPLVLCSMCRWSRLAITNQISAPTREADRNTRILFVGSRYLLAGYNLSALLSVGHIHFATAQSLTHDFWGPTLRIKQNLPNEIT